MQLGTLLSMTTSGQLAAAAGIARLAPSLYRPCWLAAAGRAGVLTALAEGPQPLETLAARLEVGPEGRDALLSWLSVGVSLGELARAGDTWRLRSSLSRRLAQPEHDPALAALEELVGLHTRLLLETPARLRERRPFQLADQDGEVIARSSRIVEPLIHEAVRAAVPAQGATRLLEVGCGTGTHLRAAAACNPALTALGLELQPEVAAMARGNLARWGLADRVRVESGDVRARPASPEWDLVTLHQNIYYFPVAERPALLAHVRGFLRPGGRLLLTTGCRGGSVAMGVLDLWGAATEGAGRLPDPDELVAQLGEAGYMGAASERLVPGEALFAFTATKP